ncbi:hypothetical protein WKI65_38175 [Streptomyces sp. MS1.AVA.3]|uniref:hypothetical protein n=1 Tax=Streptomyces decoyicus TaxID=249567 RepID=UPI0030BE1FE4
MHPAMPGEADGGLAEFADGEFELIGLPLTGPHADLFSGKIQCLAALRFSRV